jgi:PPM family protein phosphatase
MSGAVTSEQALFEVAALSHAGRVRETNEDSCATFVNDLGVGLVVADGVSSFHGADEASRIAVEVTLQVLLEQEDSVRLDKRLHRAVQQANIAIYNRAMVVPELRSMATTLTAVVLAQGKLYGAHVGDCRLYVLREGQLLQLTRDHTVTAERTRLGVMSKERARNHPDRSTLTRSVGRELIARVDQLAAPIYAQDVLVLCSDGLYNVVEDAEIARLSAAVSAETACRSLIDAANERGSPDNVTAAVARVTAGPVREATAGGLFGALLRSLRRSG